MNDFLKKNFKLCANINNYVPVRPWFDEDEKGQWVCGYRDDMIAQFKQYIYNKNFSLQNLGKNDENDTLQNRIKFWPNNISNSQGPVLDDIINYDYNDEGLDLSVRGAEIFPEIGELKNILDILRYE